MKRATVGMTHGMRSFIVILVAAALVALTLSGCINRQTADISDGADLSRLKSVYVLDHGRDKYGVSGVIRDQLIAMGFKVTVGTDAKPPKKVDAIATYADRWMWDISMYLLELTITLTDTDTGIRLATGNSFHTSLTRKSKEEMVAEVLGNIFVDEKRSVLSRPVSR